MSSRELQLISRIINRGEITKVVEWGIQAEDFRTGVAAGMFKYLIAYYSMPASRGSVIGPAASATVFPNFALCDDPYMTTEALCFEVRQNRIALEANERMDKIREEMSENPISACAKLSQLATEMIQLGSGKMTDVMFGSAYDRILDNYQMKKAGMDFSVGQYPWSLLQKAAMGLQSDDYIVFYGRPKCIPLGTLILNKSGGFTPIENAETVLSLNQQTQKLEWDEVDYHHPIISTEVVEVQTQSGYITRIGIEHPLITADLTYKPVGQLNIGDIIGLSGSIPNWEIEDSPLPLRTCELLGLLTGDGNYTRNEVQFTKEEPSVIKRLSNLVNDMDCFLNHTKDYSYRIIGGPCKGSAGGSNSVLNLLKQVGVHGSKSREKKIPARIFSASKEGIARFIGGLFSTDCYVSKGSGLSGREVVFGTSSRDLAHGIKHLLSRLSIIGSLREGTDVNGKDTYTVIITAIEQHKRLLKAIRHSASHKPRLRDLTEIAHANITPKRNDDGVPYSLQLESEILAAKEDHGEWPKIWKGKFDKSKLFRRSGMISRQLLRKLARELGAPHLLRWADSSIRWEPITKIKHLGVQRCIDISVVKNQNFIVDGFISHNSYKSWVLAYMAASLFMQDKRLIIYTKEMTAENIFMRIIGCLAQVPYQEFRQGGLNHQHEVSLYQARRMINILGNDNNVVVLSGKDAPAGGDTVPWLQSKIKTYQPHACIIDGMYLMSDVKKSKDKHQKVSSISNDLRQMNLETKVPVIATLQANRAAAKNNEANLDELAFSDSIGQDATMVMRVINEKETPTAMMVLGGAREFALNGLRINAIPAMNFEQYGSCDDDARITAKDIDKAKDKDTDGDKDAGTNGHAKPRPSNGLMTKSQEHKAMQQDLDRGFHEAAVARFPNAFPARGY